jgi:hypothetical protein
MVALTCRGLVNAVVLVCPVSTVQDEDVGRSLRGIFTLKEE